MRNIWIFIFLFQNVPEIVTRNNIKSNILPFFLDFNICHSKTCYRNAENLLSSMNTSVDPCVDFYEFACGNWIAKSNKPVSEPTWSKWEYVITKVEQQIQHILETNQTKNDLNSLNLVRNMYQACINFENTETNNIFELLNLLDEYGGLPLLNSSWKNSEFWMSTIGKINSKFNIHPLLNFHVSLNLYNTSQYILYIDQPTFAFPQWILSNPNSYKLQIKAYFQWIFSSILEIAQVNNINVSYNDIELQVHDIVQFEIQIASLINLKEDRNITNLYRQMTVNELQLWTDLISLKNSKIIIWSDIMKTLFSSYNISIDNDDSVIIKDVVYLLKLIRLLENTSPKTFANYVGWSIIKYFAKDVTKNLQTFSFAIDTVLLGVQENLSRKQECIISLKTHMNLPISYSYINKYIDDSTKKEVEDMMKNINSVLINILNSLNWMDNNTKKHALEKAEAISYLVGYPEYLKNVTFIAEYYQELIVTDNNVKNIINWNKFNRKHEFMKLRSSLQTKKWYNAVMDVNAYYSILENSIIVPAGLLQFPFYDSTRLRALNYGAIGTIIAHEFSHAFDNTGRQADKNGNIKQWWTTKSLTKYRKNLHCFQNHFSKYIIEMLQSTFKGNFKNEVNNENSLDENIADVIGLKLAYEAYKNVKQNEIKLPKLEIYTSEQLFFIAFANQWCEVSNSEQILNEIMDGDHIPNKIRIQSVLSNSEEFNKAFNCKNNFPMNPNKKCKLW